MRRPMHSPTLALAIAALLLGGCASNPPSLRADIATLQSDVSALRADPRIAGLADPELRDAEVAVALFAEQAARLDRVDYEQSLYLTQRLVLIAEAEGRARFATGEVTRLGELREQLTLNARENEAMLARNQALLARDAAQLAQQQAQQASAAARLAQQEADAARQRAFIDRNDAEDARARARASEQSVRELQSRLVELQTQQTSRGLLVTLSDVLFEFGRADLKPGATRELDQLVLLLQQNTGSTVSIEGHTDAVGSHAYNLDLSQQRADAVRSYLLAHGVAADRVDARGLGPDFPVASNDDNAGRQQNRRVEVVIRDPSDS